MTFLKSCEVVSLCKAASCATKSCTVKVNQTQEGCVHCFKSIRMSAHHSGKIEYLIFTATQNESLYVLAVYGQADGSPRLNHLTSVMVITSPLH